MESYHIGKFTYTNEMLGYHHGQYDFEAGIWQDDDVLGVVSYTLYNGALTISDILVHPKFRRKGIGSRLVKFIKQINSDSTYEPSMKTEDGSKFTHKDVDLGEAYIVKETINESAIVLHEQVRRTR